jgi:hypothetical protein
MDDEQHVTLDHPLEERNEPTVVEVEAVHVAADLQTGEA